MFGDMAIQHLLEDTRYQFETVLDIGSGSGEQARAFEASGKTVITVDLKAPALHVMDWNNLEPLHRAHTMGSFDLIWCCHVLEHQENVRFFLTGLRHHLHDGSFLALTVPPRKDAIVGGHVSLWNLGLLLYRLILAGFNCKNAEVMAYGYNLSVIVPYDPIEIMPPLVHDSGDIETLDEYFPFPVEQGFDGSLEKHLMWSPNKTWNGRHFTLADGRTG